MIFSFIIVELCIHLNSQLGNPQTRLYHMLM